MPAPTVTAAKPQAQNQQVTSKAPAPLVPFTRAARKMSRLIGQYQLNAGTTVFPFSPIQLPAAGFLRFLRLTVTGTTSGNTAAVAFNNDGPFNALQNISILTANGDALTSPIDGFMLAMINKYFALGRGRGFLTEDPNYSVTTGTGATGGSFTFQIRIPFEVDPRDAFCSLENMAANQSYLLQASVSPTSQIYTTPPTNPPAIKIRLAMEYWAAPSANTPSGVSQQTAPNGDGSVSLIQTQQPPTVPGTNQNIQLVNVGNTVRSIMFINRNASTGARDDANFPDVSTIYQNGQPLMAKTQANWRTQMAQDYGLFGGVTATVTNNALDTGVYVITDFMNDGAQGGEVVQASANRDLLLVTGSQTALNYEATSNWGGTQCTLTIVQNNIRPVSPQGMYAPFVI